MSTLTSQGLYGSTGDEDTRRTAFLDGEVPVAVYGLGKMGLPLAGVYAETCGNVIGADIDPSVVETINDGDCHVKREPGLDDLVADLVTRGAIEATSNPDEASRQASVHVVIVPTPITDANEPDLSILRAAVESIGSGLAAGDTVIIECTVPPGTTAGLVTETLVETSGLDCGEFGVAFCPERTSSGRALEDIRGAYPKVVGGIDDESTRVAELIYSEINDKGIITVSDTTTAEAVKVFEGLYRDVNIALANELGRLTDEIGIDVREAIDVANSQPFCNIHDPGPGVGGHCIPFYPYFIIDPFETETPLLQTARSVNDSMPEFVVRKLEDHVSPRELSDVSVGIFGLTYRAGVEELRAAPALDIAESLQSQGVDVFGVDPLVEESQVPDDIHLKDLDEVYDESLDAIVLVTGHEEFTSMEWAEFGTNTVIIDGRDILKQPPNDMDVYRIGSGDLSINGGFHD